MFISVQFIFDESLDRTRISVQFAFSESLDLTVGSDKPECHIECPTIGGYRDGATRSDGSN